MLFKTVYGPELECIWDFLAQSGPLERETINRCFLPVISGEMGNRTNLDDAITFLLSAGMVFKTEKGQFAVSKDNNGFMLTILSNIREIQFGSRVPIHVMDPWYIGLLEHCFIKPDQPVMFGLHRGFNGLDLPEALSEEKVNAWKRVLEFMGLGYRLFGGFYAIYSQKLVEDMIEHWAESEGPLQIFLEEVVTQYLPWETSNGEISSALLLPLIEIEKSGRIILEQKQDLPYKAYIPNRQVKWIRRGGI